MIQKHVEPLRQYKGIVVSHTHWDRAWYWPFEQFRIRLVQTMDQVIDTLNEYPTFKSFTFDGQTIIMEDYLELRPDRRADLERLVGSHRLFIGPWYVLPDEFLVSGESLIRNLILGHRIARQFGHVMNEGYVGDPFGHIHQLPQILKNCGIRSFIFTRGMNEEVKRLGSEFWWEAPDGSKVLAIYQRDNYGNLASWGFPFEHGDFRFLRPDPAVAVRNVVDTFARIKTLARTNFLLFHNGSDHLPIQPEVPDLLTYANEKLPDLKLSHGNFTEFVDFVLSAGGSSLETYHGELVGSVHHPILLSVYSTRMYLKQLNHHCQVLLERFAEPISAWTFVETKNDYGLFIQQAWRELLKNHPHDDICGCGVDEIHRENIAHAERVLQIGHYVRENCFAVLAKQINTSATSGKPVVVFNPLELTTNGVFRIEILFPHEDQTAKQFTLVDSHGKEIPFIVISRQMIYRMEILNGVHYQQVIVDAFLDKVPPCGYTTIYVAPGKARRIPILVRTSSRSIENSFLKVTAAQNGSLTVVDLRTGESYPQLNVFEDSEDTGDEYTYSWGEIPKTISTLKDRPRIRIIEAHALRATLAIAYSFKLPVRIAEDRKRRSREKVLCPLVSYVTLTAGSSRVDIRTEFINHAEDHRLRVVFPTSIKSPVVHVAEHFDVLERSHTQGEKPTPKKRFEYYGTKHQEEFVSFHDAKKGLTIANKGLPEYESHISEQGVTYAMTLLRSIGQLSRSDFITRANHAGPAIPTPEAQCPGKHVFEYSLIPHGGSWLSSKTDVESRRFVTGVSIHNIEKNQGHLPDEMSLMTIEPTGLVLSSVKRSEDKTGVIVRLYNTTREPIRGLMTTYKPIAEAEVVTMLEEFVEPLNIEKPQSLVLLVGPKQILTVKVLFK